MSSAQALPGDKRSACHCKKVGEPARRSTAKVHVSKMGEENATAEAVGALNRAAGHVRSEIAKRMHIRKAPEFRFVADDGAKYAAHINELIAGLEREER